MNMYEQLVSVYTFDNVPLLVASVITFGFGFWEYIYSFRVTLREKSSPFPLWMHTFYFAHDSSWAILLLSAAPKYNNHWFLVGGGIALIVWTMFEMYNILFALTEERNEIWERDYPNGITFKNALFKVIVQIVGFYALVNIMRVFMGTGSFFQWTVLTNILMAVGPGILWLQRGSRKGASVGLAVVILLGTINTFIPSSMFILALPEYFDHPWYYISGVVFSLIAAINLFKLLKFPKKQQIPGQKKPIW